jgi:membrane-bound lytic murein transglycosylase B
MKQRLIIIVSLMLPLLAVADHHLEAEQTAQNARLDYVHREDVREFVKELAAEASFNEHELLSVLSHAEYKQNIIDAISRPAERVLNWAEYQDIFLTEKRTNGGIAFMHDNREALLKAYEVYGVSPVIVTAIIGVETYYGRIAGNYRVLDALATLGFDYPPRSGFFRKQLKEFILLAREEKKMITDLKGSYAGAMGMGQFIPSSYRAYAVDFDGDGTRDIWDNPTDAIGSVANYLHRHGWRRDEDITLAVDAGKVSENVPGDVFNVSLKPTVSIGELVEMGVSPGGQLDEEVMVSPMRLEGKQGDEYWIGMHNFYVITRYNHSKLYAMAVFQLSEDLRKGAGTLAAR